MRGRTVSHILIHFRMLPCVLQNSIYLSAGPGAAKPTHSEGGETATSMLYERCGSNPTTGECEKAYRALRAAWYFGQGGSDGEEFPWEVLCPKGWKCSVLREILEEAVYPQGRFGELPERRFRNTFT